MSIVSENRAELEAEIFELEARLSGLRAMLPATFNKFYVFNTSKRRVWTYASDREEANRKLRARMDHDYGIGGWKIESKTVTVYDDPTDAVNHSPGNLFRTLTREEGLQLLQDYQRNQAGREPLPKGQPRSGFDKDAEAFELLLKKEQQLK